MQNFTAEWFPQGTAHYHVVPRTAKVRASRMLACAVLSTWVLAYVQESSLSCILAHLIRYIHTTIRTDIFGGGGGCYLFLS